jgi:CHAP domain/Putative peptidoglycan binding domain
MTVPLDVIQIAKAEIGYAESPAGSNLNKFGKWYGMDGVQWCAIFVSYCFYNAQLPLPATERKGFAYCPSGVKWFRDKGQFFDNPKVGDVVFFDWYKGEPACISDADTHCSDAWHIGIVESVNADGSITSIEGNTSNTSNGNGGEVMRRIRFSDVWYGFGRPSYSNQANPVQETDHPRWSGRYITLTSPFTKGDDVRLWKQQMIARGWNLGSGSDNVFDLRSDEVLRKFQKEKGIEMDGKIGPISWNAAWELAVTS